MEKKSGNCVGVLLITVSVLGWLYMCAVLFYSTGSVFEGIMVGLILYLLFDGFLGFPLTCQK